MNVLMCTQNLGKVRLSSLPSGYKMYEHHRRNKNDLYIYGEYSVCKPGYQRKEDIDNFIQGHPSKQRFRSAIQFAKHLLWLDQKSKSASAKCDCHLCIEAYGGKREHSSGKHHTDETENTEESVNQIYISETLTPHQLGISNPRSLRKRNKASS
jgi:hypothetical protein